MTDLVGHYRSLLSRVYADRRYIVVSRSLDRARSTAHQLTELGAHTPFLVAADGPHPVAEADAWSAGLSGDDDRLWEQNFDALLAAPPSDLSAALNRYDPDHSALVLDSRDSAEPRLLDRGRYGWRRADWAAVEDKVSVAGIWAAAGIHRAPERVVPATVDDLRVAAADLDRGLGTVWAADATHGVHSGGSGLRWVTSDRQHAAAGDFMRGRGHLVRVMPFVEGVPCSVHGFVMPGGVAVLRPLEIIVYRRPGGILRYGGVSTYWDPAPAAYEAIRAAAHAIGRVLADRGYRGGFTFDAVLTADAVVPTELNARLGTGLNLSDGLPGLPVALLDRALREDEPGDYHPEHFTTLSLQALHRVRAGYAKLPLVQSGDRREYALRTRPGGGYEVTEPGDAVDAVVTMQDSRRGTQARFQPASGHLLGALVGPRSLAAFTALRANGLLTVDAAVATGVTNPYPLITVP